MLPLPDIAWMVSVDFEVFGHVQGCYFTKSTRDLCVKAGLTGWVKNSKQGTIVGKMQGHKDEVEKMMKWLSNEGSPECHIEKCEFRNMITIVRLDYQTFDIRF